MSVNQAYNWERMGHEQDNKRKSIKKIYYRKKWQWMILKRNDEGKQEGYRPEEWRKMKREQDIKLKGKKKVNYRPTKYMFFNRQKGR